MPRERNGWARLSLFAAAFLFSTGGAAIKASALANWQIAGYRSGIAAVVLFALIPGARKGWTWRVWAVGVAYAATLILFVLANRMTTSANAIFLQSTAPFYLLLLGPLVLREPVRRLDLAMIFAIAAGALMLLSGTDPAAATAPNPGRGNLLALVSGVAWALTIAGLRWMGRGTEDASAATATVITGNILAFLACLPMAVTGPRPEWKDAAVLLYLGIFQIALAYFLLTRSLRELSGLQASTLLLVEPALNPLWSWLLHGERASGAAIAGGSLILATSLITSFWQARNERRPTRNPASV